MNPAIRTFLIADALWNLIVFCLFAIDKHRAKRGQWRIRERTLLLSAFLLGGLGAFLGVFGLRHKSQHLSFKLTVPLALILTLAADGGICWLLAR